ncbi:MAG: flavin reductase [bacterium]
MKAGLTELAVESLTENIFTLLDKEWMLITAGTPTQFNMMTASWGGFGVLWNRNVCFCFIRPQRYTYQFMEKANKFSLSFFPRTYRSALDYCGSRSGRNVDKARECGLTPVEISAGVISFAEARLILECRKLYFQDINPEHFLDPAIHENYPGRDYHRMYIGEIKRCLIR